jgi:hypothetical protein
MKSNKILLTVCIAISAILIISLVMAVPKDNNSSNKNETRHSKLNYGQCVYNLTIEKFDCFKDAQQDYKDCRNSIKNLTQNYKENNMTLNRTEMKIAMKNCLSAFKTEITSCKTVFKQNKIPCGQFKCKENEVFLNNTCIKPMENQTIIINQSL